MVKAVTSPDLDNASALALRGRGAWRRTSRMVRTNERERRTWCVRSVPRSDAVDAQMLRTLKAVELAT